MKHTYTITQDQVEPVKALLDAAGKFTKGSAEFVTIIQVQTEDERLAAILDQLLVSVPDGKKTVKGQGISINSRSTVRMWTIVATGEKITQGDLEGRLEANLLPVGAMLDHSCRAHTLFTRTAAGSWSCGRW